MIDWNVVVTVRDGHFKAACDFLQSLGRIRRTHYYNMLVMKVADIRFLLEQLRERSEAKPEIVSMLSRVAPVTQKFEFQAPEEFETKAQDIALGFVPQLRQKRFHVRMHRHGFKEKLHATDEERHLGSLLIAALDRAGTSGQVDFHDPDAILDVETVDNQAGLALWCREDLNRYPFLSFD